MPCLALTAYASERDREYLLSEGFTYFLAKPFSMNELVDKIKEIEKCSKNVIENNRQY